MDNYWKIVNMNSSQKIKGTNYVKTTNKSNNCYNTQTSRDMKQCSEENGPHKEVENLNMEKYINLDQDDRFVAEPPFRNQNRPVSNISSAIKRIISFLRSKPETIEKVRSEFNKLEEENIIERTNQPHYILPILQLTFGLNCGPALSKFIQEGRKQYYT
ncbi:hypothetical protein SNEBB_006459 [Seison nebaliae]|nr:hypothetical protein SNEBB_006459 [Seison nebaliae]